MKDLNNRVALVTGSSRGIGAAVAIALAKVGADVVVNYRQRANAANAVSGEIAKMGRKAIAIQADVSIAADVKRMVAEVEAHLGGIDILVNNAAIAHPRKLEEITEAEWDEVLAVNLKSVFLVTQAVVGGMRRRKWGRIINLSSVAAQTGGAVGAHYAASKAGIIGLTHSCASAFVREGITVNAIAPALIETDSRRSKLIFDSQAPLHEVWRVEFAIWNGCDRNRWKRRLALGKSRSKSLIGGSDCADCAVG